MMQASSSRASIFTPPFYLWWAFLSKCVSKSIEESIEQQAKKVKQRRKKVITRYEKKKPESAALERVSISSYKRLQQDKTGIKLIGKDEVTSSNLVSSSRKAVTPMGWLLFCILRNYSNWWPHARSAVLCHLWCWHSKELWQGFPSRANPKTTGNYQNLTSRNIYRTSFSIYEDDGEKTHISPSSFSVPRGKGKGEVIASPSVG